MKISEIVIPKFMINSDINNKSYIDGIFWEQYLTKQDQKRIAQYRSIFSHNNEFNNGIKAQIRNLLRVKQIENILT